MYVRQPAAPKQQAPAKPQQVPPAKPQQSAPTQSTNKSEICQVFEQIASKTGLPPQKVQKYTEAFEDQEVYNKQALYLVSSAQLEEIA